MHPGCPPSYPSHLLQEREDERMDTVTTMEAVASSVLSAGMAGVEEQFKNLNEHYYWLYNIMNFSKDSRVFRVQYMQIS